MNSKGFETKVELLKEGTKVISETTVKSLDSQSMEIDAYFTIASISYENSGSYSCRASNEHGSFISTNWTINVVAPPSQGSTSPTVTTSVSGSIEKGSISATASEKYGKSNPSATTSFVGVEESGKSSSSATVPAVVSVVVVVIIAVVVVVVVVVLVKHRRNLVREESVSYDVPKAETFFNPMNDQNEVAPPSYDHLQEIGETVSQKSDDSSGPTYAKAADLKPPPYEP